MFDFLKKKIGGFIDGLTQKEDEKAADEKIPEPPTEIEKEPEKSKEKNAQPKIVEPAKIKEAPKVEVKKEEPKTQTLKIKLEEAPKKTEEKKETQPKVEPPKIEIPKTKKETIEKEEESPILKIAKPEPQIVEKTPVPEQKEEEKPKERMRLGVVSTVKSLITREVEITEKDVREMLDNLELELLESDVDMGVAESIKQELEGKLLGVKVKRSELHQFISSSIKQTLIDVLSNEKAFDLAVRAEGAEKPLKIAFLGINGAGKTTTIAKVAKLLMDKKKKVVFAAADTFRAAAIEQMSIHGERLGVKVIKRDYGSDPTSVAFDAVNYGKAHGIDVVLIDTAGRQDTNISLINEMKKLNRVIQPDIKIYIGESIAGNAIIEQISAFNREIGIDAVILTKLDCDPKGGTMLSINKATGIPIIYVGIGQGYDDLEKFDPKSIVDRIVE